MAVRCKFRCISRKEFLAWEDKIIYEYEFIPVSDDTPENKKFWEATPAGLFKLTAVHFGLFGVGLEYYLDVLEAEKPTITTSEGALNLG